MSLGIGSQKDTRRYLTLENKYMSVTVDAFDGGRIIDLSEKRTQLHLIWINQRTSHAFRYYGCNYDDLSNSGIEEAFPTVQPCLFENTQHLPFFGEIWTLPWSPIESENSLTLSCKSPIFPAELRKTFHFSEDCIALVVDYEIENLGAKAFPYVFGVHPSLTLFDDSRLYAPQESYKLCSSTPQKAEGVQEFDWPCWNDIDFSKTMPADRLGCYNLISMPVKGDHYGVFHPSVSVGLDVRYDPDYFRCLSLWPIYGGFRGHTCLMSEVFTCYPAELNEAVQLGLAETLQAGAIHRTTVTYSIIKDNPMGGNQP